MKDNIGQHGLLLTFLALLYLLYHDLASVRGWKDECVLKGFTKIIEKLCEGPIQTKKRQSVQRRFFSHMSSPPTPLTVPSSKLSRISFFVSNFTLESTWLLGHQTPAAWKQTQSNPGRQSKAWNGNYKEKVWQRWHLVSSDLLTTTTSPTRALFSPPPTSW